MKNKCSSCDGKGKNCWALPPEDKEKECYSCRGTGIDSRYKSEIVCPYCGEEESDSWEAADSDDDRECGSCGKHFAYNSETSREFNSWQVPCLNDPAEHDWKEQTWYVPSRKDEKVYVQCGACKSRRWIPEAEFDKKADAGLK